MWIARHTATLTKSKDVTDRYYDLLQTHKSLIQRYQADMDKSDVNVRYLRDQLEHQAKLSEQLKHERDDAVRRAHDHGQEAAVLSERLREYARQAQQDAEDALVMSRRDIVALQAQWAVEREKMQADLMAVQRTKVDLQVCVGCGAVARRRRRRQSSDLYNLPHGDE